MTVVKKKTPVKNKKQGIDENNMPDTALGLIHKTHQHQKINDGGKQKEFIADKITEPYMHQQQVYCHYKIVRLLV